MISAIKSNWRSYVFIPSGEAVRGIEVAILSVLATTMIGVTNFGDWQTYAAAAGIGIIQAVGGYIKGKLPLRDDTKPVS